MIRRSIAAAAAAFMLVSLMPGSAMAVSELVPPTGAPLVKPALPAPEDVAPVLPGDTEPVVPDTSIGVTEALSSFAPTDVVAPDGGIAVHALDPGSAAALQAESLPEENGDGRNRISFGLFASGDIVVVQDPWSISGHAGLFDRSAYRTLASYAVISANVTPVRAVQREACSKYRLYDRAYGLYVPSVGSGAYRARDFAVKQIGKPYDLGAAKWQTRRYYCSLLVWASYWNTYLIDLDGDGGYWVLPADLLRSDKTRIFGVWM